jgi:mono/diheme cytochrome c family protein
LKEKQKMKLASFVRAARSFLFAAALAVLAAVAVNFASPAGALAADQPEWNDMPVPYDNPDAVEKGRERFSERCAFCHGGGGKGAKGPCLVCGHFKRGGTNSQVYANIAAGVPGTQMGAFGTTLEQEEINNIVAFLRAQQIKKAAEEAGK